MENPSKMKQPITNILDVRHVAQSELEKAYKLKWSKLLSKIPCVVVPCMDVTQGMYQSFKMACPWVLYKLSKVLNRKVQIQSCVSKKIEFANYSYVDSQIRY